MTDHAEAFAAALEHHKAGRLAEAEARYRRVLDAEPDHPHALHLLGLIAAEAGAFADAVALIRHAIAVDDSIQDFHNDLAAVLRNQARQAENACAQGDRHRAAGRFDQAAAAYRQAVTLRPDFAGAYLNLGTVLQELGQAEEAARAFMAAIAARPDFAEAYANLGLLFQALGMPDEAETAHRSAVELRPRDALIHYNLGSALQAQERFAEAEASFRQAVALAPSLAEAHANLGSVLQAQGRYAEAEFCQRQAIALHPELAEAHANLGNALKEQGRLGEAEAAYRHALVRRPRMAEAHANLGMTLKEQGRLEEAGQSLEVALSCGLPDPGGVLSQLAQIRRHLCRWDGLDALSGAVRTLVAEKRSCRIHPFTFLAEGTDAGAQRACAALYAAPLARCAGFGHSDWRRRDRARIGYLSADFQQHATAVLLAELIELHDRDRFDIIGYSYGRDDGGDLRRRLAAGFSRFVDLERACHDAAARCIHEDGIDILIDLKGYTQNARPEIMARRPAPIQVNWLGYPGTMGADFIDYILVDRHIAPPHHQPFYAERLVFLPDCYQVNDRQRAIAARTPTRAACGLPEHGFVFCSFNAGYKITPAVFDLWMGLLGSVPDSVLWLLDGGPAASANLRHAATARGIDPARLIFAPRRPLPDYLAQYRLADLFLDTLPVNAHTTASDALWAGLPVLTCPGDTLVSRVAASLLHAVGLPELVADTPADYHALALRLTREPERLAVLRRRLAAGRDGAPLFDTPRFARHLERAFETMLDIRSAGEPPRSFAVAEESGPI